MSETFIGFDPPTENWSKLPHALIDALPLITSEAEAKVILYILRHTWGYHDENKRISHDEFSGGRKRKDGSRIDGGTGLSENAIKDGLRRAVLHGFIEIDVDTKDRARARHYYKLKMREVSKFDTPNVGGQSLTPRVSEVDTLASEVDTRSEKETLKNNHQQETENMMLVVTISLYPNAHLHLRQIGPGDGPPLLALLTDLDILGSKRRDIEALKPRYDFVLAHSLYAASRSKSAGWVIVETLTKAVPPSEFLGFTRLSPDEWRALWRGSARGEWSTCPPQLYATRGPWLQAFEGIFESEPFIEFPIIEQVKLTIAESDKTPLANEMQNIEVVSIHEPTEFERIWSDALDRMSLEVTRATYDCYLRYTRVVNEQCNGKLIVTPTRYRIGIIDLLNKRMRPMIERAVHEAAKREIEIEFVS